MFLVQIFLSFLFFCILQWFYVSWFCVCSYSVWLFPFCCCWWWSGLCLCGLCVHLKLLFWHVLVIFCRLLFFSPSVAVPVSHLLCLLSISSGRTSFLSLCGRFTSICACLCCLVIFSTRRAEWKEQIVVALEPKCRLMTEWPAVLRGIWSECFHRGWLAASPFKNSITQCEPCLIDILRGSQSTHGSLHTVHS